ncbi:MAG: sodium:solute symporter family transporter, partial [Candidatus Xenobia bacterium]
VLVYIFLGGLTSAIYNEVLQFFLIVAGFVPLVYLGLKNVHGWAGITEHFANQPDMVHSWEFLGKASSNPMGIEWFGMLMGLGFVLSFGYWCTDFLVVQRAMSAHDMTAARRTPLIAALPKMFFPFLVILPGLIAVSLPSEKLTYRLPSGEVRTVQSDQGLIPVKVDDHGQPVFDSNGKPVADYDMAIPNLLLHYFPSGILGLGLTALLASFMSGMAGNVTAFNTVWTYDIYQSYLVKEAPDEHYVWMGRIATVVGIAISVAAAYVAASFNNIMDMLQLVFAFVNAPLFATFLLGMFWKRSTGDGAFSGLLAGIGAAALHHGLTLPLGDLPGIKGAWIMNPPLHVYPSEMAQNFWTAIFAWLVCFAVTIAVSMVTKPRDEKELVGLVYELTEKPQEHSLQLWQRPASLAVVVLVVVVVLNIVFW